MTKIPYLGNTCDHVSDEGLESSHRASLLVSSEPHLNIDPQSASLLCVLLHDGDFDWHVREVLGNSALFAFNSDFSTLHSDLN